MQNKTNQYFQAKAQGIKVKKRFVPLVGFRPRHCQRPRRRRELAPPKRAAHYLWAVLMARIYEVFPLLCPICGGQMRIIAFITHSADIR
jgi:hypothetical protein